MKKFIRLLLGLFGKKSTSLKPVQSNASVNSNGKKDVIDEQLQARCITYLESMDIILNSNNVRTIESRYDFIVQMFGGIINMKKYNYFEFNFKNAIGLYRQMYPGKEIHEDIIKFIVVADNAEYISLLKSKFFMPNMLRAYNATFEKQTKEINEAKRKDTKLKRINNLLIDLENAHSLFINYPTNIPELLELIKKEKAKLEV